MQNDYDIQVSANIPALADYFPEPSIKISQPMGADGAYFVYLDNFYQGQIVREAGRLVARLNPKSSLTQADISAIIGRIERGELD